MHCVPLPPVLPLLWSISGPSLVINAIMNLARFVSFFSFFVVGPLALPTQNTQNWAGHNRRILSLTVNAASTGRLSRRTYDGSFPGLIISGLSWSSGG